jgi:DNA-binding response OmpR family regulator
LAAARVLPILKNAYEEALKLEPTHAKDLPSHDVSTTEAHDILIVDDDRPTARALASILTDAGFHSTVLHTGLEAMRHCKREHVSAAIIDVHLPDLNGLVLSRHLRERLGDSAPIFVVSGDTSMETINSLPHVGATHFFAKPMSPAYLIEQLKESLGGNAECRMQNDE